MSLPILHSDGCLLSRSERVLNFSDSKYRFLRRQLYRCTYRSWCWFNELILLLNSWNALSCEQADVSAFLDPRYGILLFNRMYQGRHWRWLWWSTVVYTRDVPGDDRVVLSEHLWVVVVFRSSCVSISVTSSVTSISGSLSSACIAHCIEHC